MKTHRFALLLFVFACVFALAASLSLAADQPKPKVVLHIYVATVAWDHEANRNIGSFIEVVESPAAMVAFVNSELQLRWPGYKITPLRTQAISDEMIEKVCPHAKKLPTI